MARPAVAREQLDDNAERILRVPEAPDRPAVPSELAATRQRNAALYVELVDTNKDGLIDFAEFVRFDLLLNKPDAEMEICFRLADTDRSGRISKSEFEEVWTRFEDSGSGVRMPPPKKLLRRFDEAGELGVEEFKALWQADASGLAKRLKGASGRMVRGWENATMLHPKSQLALHQQSESDLINVDDATSWGVHMTGLCLAAAAAHTAVAPLDRLKIMQQALGDKSIHDTRWLGFRGIWTLWETEGLRGLWRGHTASLLRIAPLIMLNNWIFGMLRPVALHAEQGETRYPQPLSSGATLLVSGTAGMVSQLIVHPLDLLRAKMCVQNRHGATKRFSSRDGQWTGLSDSVRSVWRRRAERNRYDPTQYDTRNLREAFREQVHRGGVRGLWRGAGPAMIGAGLWTGLSFTISDTLLPLMPKSADGSGQPQAAYAMTAALWASRISQVASYPLDTLKRSMQCSPAGSTGGMRTEYSVLVAEGGRTALFRGFPVMLCKIAPSVTVSYFTYNAVVGGFGSHMVQSAMH